MNILFHKQLATHVGTISTVATDALVPKHQVISSHNADGLAVGVYYIGPVSHKKCILTVNNMSNLIFFSEKITQLFKG